MEFKGKVLIVTGGAQGIGKAITLLFLERGASVVIGDSDSKAGKEVVEEFKMLGDVRFVKTDVSKEVEVKRLIAQALKFHKRIDFLINNAGVSDFASLDKLSLKEWNRIIGINLTSVFLCSKYAMAALKKSKGAIVNIASTRALMSEPHTEAYSATKGGIVALTHSLAISVGPLVRVNCVSPGWIAVDDWKKSSKRHEPTLSKKDHDQHPVGRVGRPEDIAAMTAYLVSDEASFITGANFVVDGGMTHKMIYD